MSNIVIDIEDEDGNTICGLKIKRQAGQTKIVLNNLSLADTFEDESINAYRLQMVDKFVDALVDM